MLKATTDLEPGDRVRVTSRIVRTVRAVTYAYEGMTGLPVYAVTYEEGQTPEWGAGNTAHDGKAWTVEGVPA